MPLFQPRTRVQILRDMVARVVARSSMVGLVRNSVVFHVLASAADEDAEQYWQLSNLRLIFSIDTATGSDLDERAAEIQPSLIKRRESIFANGEVTFTRQGTTGALAIPAGTIVAAEDAQGQIKYRTTVAATIPDGLSVVLGVPIVALEAGSRGNASAGGIVQLVSRVPGVTTVTNPSALTNGQDREADAQFRARLKAYVQGLSRGTPVAIRSFALNAQLTDGRRVLFARVVEPISPTGSYDVYIDDGTGTVDEYEETYLLSDDTLIASALGGEINAYTTNRPIRDDGSFQAWKNAALMVRDTDYILNPANGQLELQTALTAGDAITARYRNYAGLIQETQRVIDGDPATLVTHPGVRAAGTQAIVRTAVAVFQTLTAGVSVKSDFNTANVVEQVETAVQGYINGLDIGENVIVAEIIERAMAVTGVFNFQISDLSGTFPAVDQFILPNQVARIVSANLNIS
jgi:uncharacterized phage protein gp47/JayE